MYRSCWLFFRDGRRAWTTGATLPARGLRAAVWLGCLGVALRMGLVISSAAARELIADGSFDHGAAQWESEARGDGEWYLTDVGSLTPVSGSPTSAEGGARDNYVVSDQRGATTLALFQSFSVPPGARPVVLSFDMFVNDWSNQSSFDPNQTARVDILTADAPVFDLGDGVVVNAFVGTDGGPLPNPFAHYVFDITPFVDAGGEFQIRFLIRNSLQNLNQGVDNVSIRAVPEPAAGFLLLAGCLAWAGISAARRRSPVRQP